MSSLENLLEQARGHYQRVNLYRHFQQDMDRVIAAQVALDTAEDTMLALEHYRSEGIGSDEGEKYLRLYGFLQAIFLQQDAIAKLHELFVGGSPAKPADETAWMELRKLRNLTVGHPVEKGCRKEPRRRTFINRIRLETDNFEYQVWDKGRADFSFECIDPLAKYAAYKQEAAALLQGVLTRLASIRKNSAAE
jgi:hypothetical protein